MLQVVLTLRLPISSMKMSSFDMEIILHQIWLRAANISYGNYIRLTDCIESKEVR